MGFNASIQLAFCCPSSGLCQRHRRLEFRSLRYRRIPIDGNGHQGDHGRGQGGPEDSNPGAAALQRLLIFSGMTENTAVKAGGQIVWSLLIRRLAHPFKDLVPGPAGRGLGQMGLHFGLGAFR